MHFKVKSMSHGPTAISNSPFKKSRQHDDNIKNKNKKKAKKDQGDMGGDTDDDYDDYQDDDEGMSKLQSAWKEQDEAIMMDGNDNFRCIIFPYWLFTILTYSQALKMCLQFLASTRLAMMTTFTCLIIKL